MKSLNWKNAIIAGIVGTLLFDLFGLVTTGEWWDIPKLLGSKTGLGMAYGVFGHYANGILIAIIYAALAPHLWGPHWLRPFIYITAETIALVWFFMLPMLGAGVAGLEMGAMTPVGTLARHFIYAVPLIYFVNKDLNPQQSEE